LPVASLLWLPLWFAVDAARGLSVPLGHALVVTGVVAAGTLVFGLPLACLSFCLAHRRVSSARELALLIYASWVLPLVAVLFVIFCSLGGMSMAAVEGAISSQELVAQAFVMSLKFTALLHAVLLPGVYCAAKLMLRWAAVWRAPGTPALRTNV
jgi:hypothetical protein